MRELESFTFASEVLEVASSTEGKELSKESPQEIGGGHLSFPDMYLDDGASSQQEAARVNRAFSDWEWDNMFV